MPNSASRLLTNYQATTEIRLPEQLQMLPEVGAGCSERPSSKAAASGEAKRTLRSTLSLCALRPACAKPLRRRQGTPLAAFINSLLDRFPHEGTDLLHTRAVCAQVAVTGPGCRAKMDGLRLVVQQKLHIVDEAE